MEITWASILTACATMAAFFSGVGVGILSLFIDNKLYKHEQRIINHFDQKFELKETLNEKIKNLDIKVDAIRHRLDKIDK